MPDRAAQLAAIVGRTGKLWPQAYHAYSTNAQANIAGMDTIISEVQTIRSWGNGSVFPLIDIKEGHNADGSIMTFAEVAAGAMDANFEHLMNGLVGLGPVICAFHNEPAGDAACGTDSDGGAANWGKSIGRMGAARDAAGATDVSVTGALGMGQYTGFGGSNGDPTPWIVGAAPYCDVWDTHRYCQATDANGNWKSVETLYDPFWQLLDNEDSTKAKIHGEWGIHTRSDDLSYSANWMRHFREHFRDSWGGALTSFFDSGENLNTSPIPWDYDYNNETSRMLEFATELTLPLDG